MAQNRPHLIIAVLAILFGSLLAAPAQAGKAEMDLLASYIGKWAGDSVLEGGKAPEPFRCRLTIAKGNQAKINYSGRCALVNMNLSVSGTIAYDDAAGNYQAVMNSNAGFTGYAVGVKRGDRIIFDLAEKGTDRGGNLVRIGSKIILTGNIITVDFEVEFNASGEILTASVPFTR